jgi:hypothetical protein
LDGSFPRNAAEQLHRAIHAAITKASGCVQSHRRWSAFRGFWRNLAEHTALVAVTLNYDTLIEKALEVGAEAQGFAPINGEDLYRFDDRPACSAPAVMHLHGSIHLGYRHSVFDPDPLRWQYTYRDLFWHPDPASALSSWGPSGSDQTQAGRTVIGGPLITGFQKPDKLLIEPLATYYCRLGQRLAEVPRLLLIGYGFGDRHINQLLYGMRRRHGDALRIAVITHFEPDEMHGSWDDRAEEHATIAMWSEQPEPFGHLSLTPAHPWVSQNGVVRVYYRGLADILHGGWQNILDYLRM